MNLRRKLKFFRSPKDFILFFRLFVDLVRIKIFAKKLPLRDFLRRFAARRKTPLEISRIEHVLRFSDFLVYGLFRGKTPCLHRSLLLYRHLARTGIDLRIVFAARNAVSGLEGHAWLTHNGRPVFYHGDPADSYRVFLVYP